MAHNDSIYVGLAESYEVNDSKSIYFSADDLKTYQNRSRDIDIGDVVDSKALNNIKDTIVSNEYKYSINDNTAAVKNGWTNQGTLTITPQPWSVPQTTPWIPQVPNPPNITPNLNPNITHTVWPIALPVDPDAPDNPVLEPGDTAVILTPHGDTWDGRYLCFPPFHEITQAEDDAKIGLKLLAGSRFKAGQLIIYTGVLDPACIELVMDGHYISFGISESYVQFMTSGRMFAMPMSVFNSLRYMRLG
jgi:hypothetical protein